MLATTYNKNVHRATNQSKCLAFFILSCLINLSEIGVDVITIKIRNKVRPCNVSTSEKEVVSVKDESIIYLLPITANKEPTLKLKQESIPSVCI